MALCLLLFVNFQLNCQENSLVLGGKNGWTDFIQNSRNLTLGKGRFGQQAIQLDTFSHKISKTTDLYISFENLQVSSVEDETGNYKVQESNLFFTENSIVGNLAGLSRGKGALLSLSGNKGSLFGEIGLTGAFKIEFWLNPAVCASGENIFFWRTSRNVNQYSDYQIIEAIIMNGKLEWKFQNVFTDSYQKSYDIYLKSSSTIVPEKWARHSICYDDETGTIEYYIDGILEGIAYTTDTGNAYGQYLMPDFGTPAKIEICRNFVGSIDELIISRQIDDVTKLANSGVYSTDGGFFESKPLDTFRDGSIVTSVKSIMNIPEQTEAQIFIRASDNFYEWDENYPKWTLVKNGKPESLVYGRFFQVATNLYTDGNGEKTPVITSIDINYSLQNPPFPPSKIFSVSGDKEITISWNQNNPDDKYGYLLYYGTKSGEYLGQEANQGDSPIDCGSSTSIKLTGLKNGRIYYFAVATYLKEYPEIIGTLSEQIYDRPLSKEGKDERY